MYDFTVFIQQKRLSALECLSVWQRFYILVLIYIFLKEIYYAEFVGRFRV